MPHMNQDELLGLPATVDLETAARALGFGRTLAYELAARGDFPCRVLRIGRKYVVPTAELRRTLGMPNDNSRYVERHAQTRAMTSGSA
jgi:hypothetical protein